MIALGDVREALATALRDADLNVSDGGDLVPNGAVIGPFVVNYHPTVAGSAIAHMAVAGCEVRVMTDRADEASAYVRLDAIQSTVWQTIEQASGPWKSVFVQTARPDAPTNVGEASYQSVSFVVEFYV